MVLQLAYFNRSREPVVMEIGPVLAVEDVAGGKLCALASRVEPRDYADTARMLERYSRAELISFARTLDSGLTARHFADAGPQLGHIDDDAFTRYGLREVAVVREPFAAWPGATDAARREMRASELDRQDPEAAPPNPGTVRSSYRGG
jgi:Nucleotidyl transferase AbiEii toxin, Type IV TA system